MFINNTANVVLEQNQLRVHTNRRTVLRQLNFFFDLFDCRKIFIGIQQQKIIPHIRVPQEIIGQLESTANGPKQIAAPAQCKTPPDILRIDPASLPS